MNRSNWVPEYHDVALNVYSLPSSDIFLIRDVTPNNFTKIWPLTYPVYGDRLQHSIKIDTQEALLDDISTQLSMGQKPIEYVSSLCYKGADCKSEFNQLKSVLDPFNYKIVASDSHAILLKLEN